MKAIELQPLGAADADVLEFLSLALRGTFSVPARPRRTSLPIEQFHDEPRDQYNSTAILHWLNERELQRAKHDVLVLGITAEDLYIPILTYVFGEAALGGFVAVVSYHRFRNELYGLPPDQQLLKERLWKVAVHELGHTGGLVHCLFQHCVMHAASSVEELDLKGHDFCPYCRTGLSSRSRQPREELPLLKH
jgi:archaemetzincin